MWDVGDVNGDGCSDLLLARVLSNATPCTRARIYSGKDDSILLEMTANTWSFGASAANLGDLDGDGAPELAIGDHESGSCEGRVWVISLGKRAR